MDNPINLPPFENFAEASHEVLRFLYEEIGLGLWMMTRVANDDWVVLQAEAHKYQVSDGTVFHWQDSFCSQMVQGFGPQVANDVQQWQVYKNSEIANQIKIGAYIGVPIYLSNGELFGTLCAIDPEPQQKDIEKHLPIVQLCARLLATVLDNELLVIEQQRQVKALQDESTRDPLTGLLNRRGWQKRLEQEISRIKRYASPASLFVIDLDNLKQVNDREGHNKGDEYIKKAALAIQTIMREEDVVARIGGDEFAMLAIECSQKGAEAIGEKLSEAFAKADIEASIGVANHHYQDSLEKTFDNADQAMYQQKRAKQNSRNTKQLSD
ncbi:sensor domain-containing diguanylate cyclase [Thiomicrorhabdus sediminis]|uniref:diguanylate cyclase n=1 Tax=Thiomicrorhabdus sediminis TaxID=2580412 RepID=A0A4P9K7J0_9GAMM|nr:sensor domain-containing diguanylate cyclase [Thiomicrorhabdus sediminis]QCU91065.1 sensor domain-containing diguanylate cyclase [Thiomicrorhabdus sediminis]